MRPTLSAFSYIYNADKYDIPFAESIRSVIDAVDEFVLTECYSDDSTFEQCQALQADYPTKIKLLRRNWVKHFTEISALANWTMDHTTGGYVMELQSDELIHESDLDKLIHLPEQMQREKKTGARWNYLHFLGSPSVLFDFCYDSLVRVVKANTPWKIIGDGVQFNFGDYIPEEKVLNSDITVFHYGKMKDPEKGKAKEDSFQNLFTDLGFPDKRMKEMSDKIGEKCDYVYLFKEHIVGKKLREFHGTHPQVMQKRLAEFKDKGFEQFVSMMEDSLRIEKEDLK